MAAQVQVFGPCQVYLDNVFFGYTRNGADFTDEGYFLDVPGDERGGDEGPPIDVQYLGFIARVRLEFTKWDAAVADLAAARVKASGLGLYDNRGASGRLMFSSGYHFNLKLVPLATTVNTGAGASIVYPLAFPRQPIEINKGTKFSSLIMEFECHPDTSGQVYYAD